MRSSNLTKIQTLAEVYKTGLISEEQLRNQVKKMLADKDIKRVPAKKLDLLSDDIRDFVEKFGLRTAGNKGGGKRGSSRAALVRAQFPEIAGTLDSIEQLSKNLFEIRHEDGTVETVKLMCYWTDVKSQEESEEFEEVEV